MNRQAFFHGKFMHWIDPASLFAWRAEYADDVFTFFQEFLQNGLSECLLAVDHDPHVSRSPYRTGSS